MTKLRPRHLCLAGAGVATLSGLALAGGVNPWWVAFPLLALLLVVAAAGLLTFLRLARAVETFAARLPNRLGHRLKDLARRIKDLSRQVKQGSGAEFRKTLRDDWKGLRKEIKEFRKQVRQDTIRSDREGRFGQLLEASRVRELPPAAIFEGIEEVAVPLGAINPETAHSNHAELLYVCVIAAHRKCRNIFEFGTFLGRTTYHLAAACPAARVITLDLPEDKNPRPGAHVGAYFRGTEREHQIVQLRCDSRAFDPAPYRGRMDLIWVDADHSYEMVKNDTEKALEMLAPGGVILWHDYAPKTIGVAEYFHEFTHTRPVFRLKGTSILLHIDGVDPMTFEPHRLRVSEAIMPQYKVWEAAVRAARAA